MVVKLFIMNQGVARLSTVMPKGGAGFPSKLCCRPTENKTMGVFGIHAAAYSDAWGTLAQLKSALCA